jgi:hypothetical protein
MAALVDHWDRLDEFGVPNGGRAGTLVTGGLARE